jgi:hypothetical protein
MTSESFGGRLGELLVARATSNAVLGEWLEGADRLRDALQLARTELMGLDSLDTHSAFDSSTAAAFEAAVASLEEQVGQLSALRPRMARTTLSLGMLGQSGMGKSRFLRSLTGLSAVEIPDAKGAAKTGVTSVIRHGSPDSAVVHFLTEDEYLRRIGTYFTSLGLGAAPSSVDDFWGRPLPVPLKEDAAYEHLRAHYEGRHDIEPLLGARPLSVASSDVVKYVAQRDAEGRAQAAFRAVDRLELTTRYPTGLSSVSVIDLPGMGETSLTHEPLVIDALRDDVDVLLVLKRPDDVRYFWGTDEENLKRLAERALPEVPLNLRSVMVLNRYVADGRDNSDAIGALLSELTPAIFDVAFADGVDASDQAQVGALYERIVEELVSRVAEADGILMARRRESWVRTAEAVQRFVNAGKRVLGDSIGISPMWRQDHAMAALTELQLALSSYRSTTPIDEPEILSRLRNHFDESMAEAAKIVSDIDQALFDRTKAQNKGSNAIAYGIVLDEQRARLIRHFAGLGPVLTEYLDEVKSRLAELLLRQGRLDRLVAAEGAAALGAIRDLLADPELGLAEDSPLLAALDTLIQSRLDYRALIGHHIQDTLRLLSSTSPWMELTDLTPGPKEGVPRQVNPILWDTNRLSTKMLSDAIEGAGLYVLFQANEASDEDLGASAGARPGGVKAVLDRSIEKPGKEIGAIVSTYVVTLLDSPHASSEWMAVYNRFAAQVWAEEFSQITAQSEALSRVDKALNVLSQVNREIEDGPARAEAEVAGE